MPRNRCFVSFINSHFTQRTKTKHKKNISSTFIKSCFDLFREPRVRNNASLSFSFKSSAKR